MTVPDHDDDRALLVAGLTAGYHSAGRGHHPVLHHVDLAVGRGELLSVLGPSGCGKSTLLRAIAGLHPADAGRIELDGREVTVGHRGLPPEVRGVGLVPQDSALFPHRDVSANIEYGLRSRRRSGSRPDRHTRRRRTAELLELVDLQGYGQRFPHELSGGERQRVALARALAPEPSIVLLDEAFGALDASLRSQLRSDVREILRLSETTGLLVTHDQDEALSISDRLAIMRDGRVVQTGTPHAVYTAPVDSWTARFLGECNVVTGAGDGTSVHCALGTIDVSAQHGTVDVLIRPEQVRLNPDPPDGAIMARLDKTEFRGHSSLHHLRLVGCGQRIIAHSLGTTHHSIGSTVSISVDQPVHIVAAPGDERGSARRDERSSARGM